MQLEHRIWTRPAPRRGLLILALFQRFRRLTRLGTDYVPDFAQSWKISDAGLKPIRFKLQSAVTFHDGTTMDAADVKFPLDNQCRRQRKCTKKRCSPRDSEVTIGSPLHR